MNEKKIYFPNLNGLRFIAAFLVIIHHIGQFKSIREIQSSWDTISSISLIGKLGVVLFFVLSGFLITYLLLVEEKRFQKISIRQFYIRRALRIWPLYFFILFLALLVLPNIEMFQVPGYGKEVIYTNLSWRLILLAFFLPNMSFYIFGLIPYANHTWSIGAEEQYYLIWPVLLKYIRKYRIRLLLTIILFYVGFKLFLTSSFADLVPFHDILRAFLISFPISCMAIGGIYSIIYFHRSSLLKYMIRNDVFYFSLGLVSVLMLMGIYIPYVHYEFYSVFFGLIILNFSVNNRIHISLENMAFTYLGKISYGLYMYHPIAIILAISLGLFLKLDTNWFYYPVSLIFSVIIAGLSYRYFESFFLRYKKRFSKVLSGHPGKRADS